MVVKIYDKDFEFKDEEEKNNFLKKIYQFCEKSDWDTVELMKLSKEIRLSIKYIRKCALLYSRNSFSREKYLDDYEKSNEKFNHFLYNYLEEVEYKKDEIQSLALELGISREQAKIRAKQYAVEYLNVDPNEYSKRQKELFLQHHRDMYLDKNRFRGIYEELLQSSTLEESINIFQKYNYYRLNDLHSGLSDYIIAHGKEEDRKIIFSMLDCYKEYKKEEKSKKLQNKKMEEKQQENEKLLKLLPQAKIVIKGFITSGVGKINNYCELTGLEPIYFSECIQSIKEFDKNYYLLYRQYLKDAEEKRQAEILAQAKELIEFLKHGVYEGGVQRPFTIVDFFENFNHSLKEYSRASLDVVSPSDYTLLSKFIYANTKFIEDRPKEIEHLFCQDKDNIVNYLIAYKIPINMKTFNITLKRYRQGVLNDGKPKVKKCIRSN